MTPQLPDLSTESNESQFQAAQKLLTQLIADPKIQHFFQNELLPNTRRVYTHAVTLWMLILQRLGGGKALSEVVQHVLSCQRNLLPPNKRVRERTLSHNTAAYSQARRRLPLDFIQKFSTYACEHLSQMSEPLLGGRRIFILDGTTITLPPTAVLKKAYPPAPNQYGESVWPVAMLLVAHELQSGCALLPQVAPMYGENNSSEARLSQQIIGKLPANSIVLGDRGFGIFSVARACVEAHHQFLFRLSTPRFKTLRRAGELREEGDSFKTYQLIWTPSAKDLANNSEIPPDAEIEVLVHDVTLKTGIRLYLVSNLETTAQQAADLYSCRYNVEFDIRDLKVTMDTENIRAKSVEMFQKELDTSVVAYNLVTQFRRQAAQLANVPPRRLSFQGVWRTFRYELLMKECPSFHEWMDLYAKALAIASRMKLPVRKKPRSYPRIAHPRHSKTTKYRKPTGKKSLSNAEESIKIE